MAGLMAYKPIPKTAARANTAARRTSRESGEGLFQVSGGFDRAPFPPRPSRVREVKRSSQNGARSSGRSDWMPVLSASSVVIWSVCHAVSRHVGRCFKSPWYDSLLLSHLSSESPPCSSHFMSASVPTAWQPSTKNWTPTAFFVPFCENITSQPHAPCILFRFSSADFLCMKTNTSTLSYEGI